MPDLNEGNRNLFAFDPLASEHAPLLVVNPLREGSVRPFPLSG